MFAKLDEDANGKVSLGEFVTYMGQMKQEKGPKISWTERSRTLMRRGNLQPAVYGSDQRLRERALR